MEQEAKSSVGREQVRRDAEEVRGVLRSDVETPEQRDDAEEAFDRILAEMNEIERGWSEDDKSWRERLEQAERERDEARAARHADLFAEESSLRADLDAAETRLTSVTALVEALRYYAELGDDDIPYAETINDPPDVGRTARDALTVYEQSQGKP